FLQPPRKLLPPLRKLGLLIGQRGIGCRGLMGRYIRRRAGRLRMEGLLTRDGPKTTDRTQVINVDL
ncbi:MAG: hypothetical protein ABSH28_06540, partial [Acidobacteriota bacterium]